MFLNPIWSVLLLVAVASLYVFVIRPRLAVAFTETYTHIDGWWARQFARLYGFRSFAATAFACLMIALPDIAVAIMPIDLTWLVGPKWAPVIVGLLASYLAVNRAFATKPGNERA